jgi:pilus assembly protein Flp/PilA
MTRITEFVLQAVAAVQARKGEEGQGMAEYGLILALVAVVVAVAVQTLGTDLVGKIEEVSTALG